MKCTSSTITSAASGTSAASSRSTAFAIRSETNRSSRAAVSAVGGSARPTTVPSSGSHGSSSGAAASTAPRSRRSTSPAGACGPSWRARRRIDPAAPNGWLADTCAHWARTVRTPAARARSSPRSRVLPMPGSPVTSASAPLPVSGALQRAEQHIELVLPPDKRADRLQLALPDAAPTSRRPHQLGLPLGAERLDGRQRERGPAPARAPRSRTRSWPSSARAMIRAAVLITSP